MKIDRRPPSEIKSPHTSQTNIANQPTTAQAPVSLPPQQTPSSAPLQQTREQRWQRAQTFAQTGQPPTLMGSTRTTSDQLRQQLEARFASVPVSTPVKGSDTHIDLTEGTVVGSLSLSTPLPSVEVVAGAHFSGTVEGGPFRRAEVSMTVGSVDESGLISVQVTVSSEQGAAVGGSAEYQMIEVGGTQQSGQRESMTYELKLTREQFDAMLRGEMPFPNPADPTTLPPGSSVLAVRERFQEGSIEAAVSAILAGVSMFLGSESTQGESFAIEALEDKPGTIRITVGPHEGVFHSLGVGISGELAGIGVHAGLDSSWSLQEKKLQSIEIDLTTPEGQAAYQHFLDTGELPLVSPPAVSNYKSIEKLSKEQALSLGLSFGPFEITHQLWDTHSELIVQHGPEGTTYSFTHDARTNNGMQVSWIERPDGTIEFVSMNLFIGNPHDNAKPSVETDNPLLADAHEQRWLGETLQLFATADGIQELRNDLLGYYRNVLEGSLFSQTPPGSLDYEHYPPEHPLHTLLNPNASSSEFARAYESLCDSTGGLPAFDPLSFALLTTDSPTDAAFAMIRFGALEQMPSAWGVVLSHVLQQDPYALHSTNVHLSNAP